VDGDNVALVALSGSFVHERELMEASFVDGSPAGCVGGVVFGLGRPCVASTMVFFHAFAFNECSGAAWLLMLNQCNDEEGVVKKERDECALGTEYLSHPSRYNCCLLSLLFKCN